MASMTTKKAMMPTNTMTMTMMIMITDDSDYDNDDNNDNNLDDNSHANGDACVRESRVDMWVT